MTLWQRQFILKNHKKQLKETDEVGLFFIYELYPNSKSVIYLLIRHVVLAFEMRQPVL